MADETTNQEVTEVTETKSVDLSALTADQLLALSEDEWQAFYATVKAAVAAKAAEEKAKLKSEIAAIVANFKTYVLPAVNYIAGAAVLLKVFGVI